MWWNQGAIVCVSKTVVSELVYLHLGKKSDLCRKGRYKCCNLQNVFILKYLHPALTILCWLEVVGVQISGGHQAGKVLALYRDPDVGQVRDSQGILWTFLGCP